LVTNGSSNKTKNWGNKPTDDFTIEENLKTLSQANSKSKSCVLAFNLNIPVARIMQLYVCLNRIPAYAKKTVFQMSRKIERRH
jgi:hypothetical protein